MAGHKDSFVEGQNQVELEIETEGVRNIILNLEYNIEEVWYPRGRKLQGAHEWPPT